MSSPPSDDRHRVTLRCETGPRWLPNALAHLDAVLVDHAHCEKKAAANALSLLQTYPEVPGLPAQMARLAREESGHLARVLQLLERRGLALGRDPGDPYAQALQALVRTPAAQRQLDRLLVAAIIEARSCERLTLLAEALPDVDLRRFYGELARSEDGHQKLFLRLAARVHGQETWPRLERLLEAEAELIRRLPIRAAIH
jgi:tRNA 2-(methylsulfanyl)-N6-isopentenyladenosine37 hydroxylase